MRDAVEGKKAAQARRRQDRPAATRKGTTGNRNTHQNTRLAADEQLLQPLPLRLVRRGRHNHHAFGMARRRDGARVLAGRATGGDERGLVDDHQRRQRVGVRREDRYGCVVGRDRAIGGGLCHLPRSGCWGQRQSVVETAVV